MDTWWEDYSSWRPICADNTFILTYYYRYQNLSYTTQLVKYGVLSILLVCWIIRGSGIATISRFNFHHFAERNGIREGTKYLRVFLFCYNAVSLYLSFGFAVNFGTKQVLGDPFKAVTKKSVFIAMCELLVLGAVLLLHEIVVCRDLMSSFNHLTFIIELHQYQVLKFHDGQEWRWCLCC